MSYCRRTWLWPGLSITHHLAVLFRLYELQAVLEELKYRAASSPIYQSYKAIKVDFSYSMRQKVREKQLFKDNCFKFYKFFETQNMSYGIVEILSLLTIFLPSNSHSANYWYGNIHKSSIKGQVITNNPFHLSLKLSIQQWRSTK